MRKSLYLPAAILLGLCASGILRADTLTSQSDSIVINTPPNGTTISGNRVDIVVSLNSDTQPASKLLVFLDGQQITERAFQPPVPHGSASFKWDTTRTPNGKHKIDIQVFSENDYIGMATCVVNVENKTIDRIPPKAKITGPRNGQIVSGTIPIIVEASDDITDNPLVSIYVDKTLQSMGNQSPYRCDWDTKRYPDGAHTIDVTVADDADNMTKAKSVTVIVRNSTEQTAQVVKPRVKPAALPKIAVRPESRKYSAPSIELPAPTTANFSEFARTLETTVDRFEVAQTPEVRKPTTSVASARTRPATSAQSIAEGTGSDTAVLLAMAKAPVQMLEVPITEATSNSVQAPILIAKASDTDAARPTDESPSAPECRASKFAIRPILMAKALSENLVRPIIKGGARLTRPGVSTKQVAVVPKNAVSAKPAVAVENESQKMVRVRSVFNNIGDKVVWNSKAKTVHAVSKQKAIDLKLKVGSRQAVVNEKSVDMSQAAALKEGRTMVPESFATDTLGVTVSEE